MQLEVGKLSSRWAMWLGLSVLFLLALSTGYFLLFYNVNTLTIPVSEDSYVINTRPDSSFNTSSLIVSNVDAECSTTANCASYTSHTYLKFKINKLPDNKKIETVTLRLNVTNLSGDGGQIYLSKSNNWTGNSITWSNAPPIQGRPVGSIGPILKYGDKDISLPPELLKSNSEFSLVIVSNDRNIVAYQSHESGKNGPQLLVTLGDHKPSSQSQNSYIVLAAGDVACGSATQNVDNEDCKQLDTAQLIGSVKPDAVLVLGDNQYENGQLSDFDSYFNSSWGRYKTILHPAIGNHEYFNSFDHLSDGCTNNISSSPYAYACGYFDYYNGRNNLDGPAGERGKGYYAFSLGNWRIYAVNSNCTIVECQVGSAQEQWFRNDLAKHVNSCKIMFMHHPISSSDTRNFDAYLEGLPDPTNYTFIKINQSKLSDLYQAFYDYGGDIALAGHSHFYERFSPQNVDRLPDKKGYTEIVVGTGGRYTYNIDSKHVRPLSIINSTAGVHGLLDLTLSADSYSWKYLSTSGNNFSDQGASVCHSAI